MKKSKLIAPEQTKLGHFTEIAQAGAGSLPFVGGLVNGVLNSVFPSELEKRRAIWEKEVSEKLNGLDLNKLLDDDAFLSLLILSTEAARRTHKLDKIKRLGNTLKNFNIVESYDLKQKFLQWLDEFTDYEFILFETISTHTDLTYHEILSSVFGHGNPLQNIVMENVQALKQLVKSTGKKGENRALEFTEVGEQFWAYCS